MTEQQIEVFGFELTKQYEHDEFHTNRYAKGVLEVEFTYEGDKLLTCDLSMEVNCKPVTFKEMEVITLIFGSWVE